VPSLPTIAAKLPTPQPGPLHQRTRNRGREDHVSRNREPATRLGGLITARMNENSRLAQMRRQEAVATWSSKTSPTATKFR